ncbi:PrgH/EprH family type III secretion apparatus protein [Erwinia pyrifoliae]|uniref:PrgH/EprH family type III secretion apparatus protein n=1 Tax=Erwinia pyrifoliae TaxID=79967 RepID=A0ABY5X3Z0_ERWPY|nr:PrgH/EprH family type III secretion apparatus protein [Erwinia pyrifoliae]AUX72530.1 PrgH/EprH family type III secretion apparatus protein [Erwinia pyrifoliae]MCA8877216.1 PrgH/EprH family type III secretion apparatus protein [Erwinia pyrifoliae]MCT2387399.1 PrgH/EprH family type III secretion apparatus protein [Erwinia pyrifoliae]MCU8587001.1 PrgH/EprH family type III secretion apparatus protein [Erwinia pyrifoliae]UWS30868.1 PrgH/EprH family type III secretion apparatus protein [Erwinia p
MISNVKDSNTTKSIYCNNTNFTLKILFGPMFGCELHLTSEDYFIIIDSESSIRHKNPESALASVHSAHYASNTLYIPCNLPSPNILLQLSKSFQGDEGISVDIVINQPTHSYQVVLHENEIFTDEHVRFAFKRNDEEWHENISNYSFHQAQQAGLEHNKSHHLKITNLRLISLVSVILMVTLFITAGYFYKTNEYENHVSTLNDSLSGISFPFDIVKDRDSKFIYILVSKLHEMEWLKEALVKLQENSSVVPVWITQQKKIVVSQLLQVGYPILQLAYSRPSQPVIAVYRQLTLDEEESLKTTVLEFIPYATDVEIIIKSKEQLLSEARNGLDSLNIQYRQIITNTGYSLIIRDALSDVIISTLRHFIQEFELKWGNKIVNFSVNLDENWLLNKSYIDSTNGYLFLNPHHWYFPLNSGEINNDRSVQR